MSRLAGKVCVVTGSSGMAADAARRFASEGAQVWVVAREPGQGAGAAMSAAGADVRSVDGRVRQ